MNMVGSDAGIVKNKKSTKFNLDDKVFNLCPNI